MIHHLFKATLLAATLSASTAVSATSAMAEPKVSVKAHGVPGLKQWGKSIGRLLERSMEYPKRFDVAGEYGAVSYQLVVGRDGRVRSSKRIQGSGYDRLDHSAANTIAKMSTLPAMPDNLAAQRAIVTVKLAYLPIKSIGQFHHRQRKAKTDMLDLAAQKNGVHITLLKQDGTASR